MIRSIHIKNFQSHADSILELSPTVTVITGESDQGKTAILRALRKVLRNIPTGDFFIRWHQTGNCEIEIDVDGVPIKRIVGKKNVNVYSIGEMEFKNFGVNIPDEVRLAMKISDVQVFEREKIDLNIRTQHESLFLVGGSGVEALRGRIFGKITGSDKINRALTVLNSNLKTSKKTLELANLRRTAYEVEITNLGYLKRAKQLLDFVQSQLRTMVTVNKRLEEARLLFAKLAEVRQAGLVMKKKLDILSTVDCKSVADKCQLQTDLFNLNNTLVEIESKLVKLEPISQVDIKFDSKSVENLQKLLLELCILKQKLAVTEGDIDSVTPVTEISTVVNLSECEDMLKLVQSYRALNVTLNTTRDSGLAQGALLRKLLVDEMAVVQELEMVKQEVGVCPVCDRPFVEEAHEH